MRAEHLSRLWASIPVADCVFCLCCGIRDNHRTSQDSPIRDLTEFNLCLEDKELFSPLKKTLKREKEQIIGRHIKEFHLMFLRYLGAICMKESLSWLSKLDEM